MDRISGIVRDLQTRGWGRAHLVMGVAAVGAVLSVHAAPAPETPTAARLSVVAAAASTPTIWTGAATEKAVRAEPPAWAAALWERLDAEGRGDATAAGVRHVGAAPLWSPYLAERGVEDPATDGLEQQTAASGAHLLIGPAAPARAPAPRRRPALLLTRADGAALEIATADIPLTRGDVAGADRVASRPRITLMLTAFGLDAAASEAALADLPATIAIAVPPVGADPAGWAERARRSGRMVVAEIPLEPLNYPRTNPGPLTLLTSASTEENATRLTSALERIGPVAGVASYLGGRFLRDADAVDGLINQLDAQGLALIEAAPPANSPARRLAAAAGLGYLRGAVDLDRQGRASDLSDRLDRLVAIAERDGHALGVAVATAATVAALKKWIDGAASAGVELTPMRPVGAPT